MATTSLRIKTTSTRRPLRCALGVAMLALSGCGLSDYQTKMDAQRARVQRLDEVNNLLGGPIEVPTLPVRPGSTETRAAWPFEFYLRLPKGYTLDKTPYLKDFAFYRYYNAEPGVNIFVAAALLVEKKGKEKAGEYTTENFRRYVGLGIEAYYFKKIPFDERFREQRGRLFIPAGKIEYTRVEVDIISPYSDVVEKNAYDLATFRDTANKMQKEPLEFRAYYHDEAGKQIAVVAQRPIKGDAERFDKSVTAMLGTLDMSVDAASKRTQYMQLKGS